MYCLYCINNKYNDAVVSFEYNSTGNFIWHWKKRLLKITQFSKIDSMCHHLTKHILQSLRFALVPSSTRFSVLNFVFKNLNVLFKFSEGQLSNG